MQDAVHTNRARRHDSAYLGRGENRTRGIGRDVEYFIVRTLELSRSRDSEVTYVLAFKKFSVPSC